MATLTDADALATEVESGLEKLVAGEAFQQAARKSPQVALRPLFCPEEVNLSSSVEALDEAGDTLTLPVSFFVDERLGVKADLNASKELYLNALKARSSRFPETQNFDADHAWLSPVKALSDIIAIDQLVASGTIDQEFITDVLAVDQTRPVFSQKRCSLLKALPGTWSSTWKESFAQTLKRAGTPEALELHSNLTDSSKNITFHQSKAQLYVDACTQELRSKTGMQDLVDYLGQVRAEIKASPISSNPRGQILEPGFRVIFPDFTPTLSPDQKTLTSACKLQ